MINFPTKDEQVVIEWFDQFDLECRYAWDKEELCIEARRKSSWFWFGWRYIAAAESVKRNICGTRKLHVRMLLRAAGLI